MALLVTAKYTFDAPRCDGMIGFVHFLFLVLGLKA